MNKNAIFNTKKFPAIVLFILLITLLLLNTRSTHKKLIIKQKAFPVALSRVQQFDSLELGNLGLSKEAYCCALKGFNNLRLTGLLVNSGVLSIVDFSLPSSRKRLFIIDVNTGRLLFNTFVSHGRNSGKEFATKFSNQFHSFQSSLGFYVTGKTYIGHHGYSLRLQGVEKGINDNALSRGIVIHAASYVNEAAAKKKGCIGRSEGCPAIPVNMHKAIIEVIKNGTCIFMYGSDKKYFYQSTYLQKLHEPSLKSIAVKKCNPFLRAAI